MTDHWKLSATDVAARVRRRELRAVDVIRDSLERLDQVNPAINAVVDACHEQALAEAEALDRAIAGGAATGPLAGVPVTVKVNADQRGRATTNGLRLQRDKIAEHDNPVVKSLRAAGAVIVGRTNTPAFSLRWFTRNSLHGHTRNPRDSRLTPGGSSGGAAAAVVSGIGAIAHGTDIAGSIRYPAYACGVHGLRPSLGRVAAANLSAPDRHIGAQLMAVSGPIARTVADLRAGLLAMAAPSSRGDSLEPPLDPWWTPVPLEGPRFARSAAMTVCPESMPVAPEVEAALRDAAARLRDAGWEVREKPCPPFAELCDLNALLWLTEMRRTDFAAVRAEDDPDASFVAAQMDARAPLMDTASLLDALQRRVTLIREWDRFLAEHPLWLCPPSLALPFPDCVDVESPEAFGRVLAAQAPMTALPVLGVPAMVLSTGLVGSTPVGVQLVAGRYREDVLFEAGTAIEARGVPPAPVDPASG